MSTISAAEAAWLAYRDTKMRFHPRRQLRRREFIAGYEAACERIDREIADWQDDQVYGGVLTQGAWSDGVRFGIEAARDIARGELR